MATTLDSFLGSIFGVTPDNSSSVNTRIDGYRNGHSGRLGVDSKIRFSIDPLPGADAFCQWKDAMRAVARLPLGIPSEFRRKVWLSLADNHLNSLRIDWNKTKRFAFNERSNPDDNKLGLQIVKDLHRTGCSGFSGHDNEEERALLKRVLLAYARWNKQVGYCQGFNVLAALILDVVDRREDDALKVMIYLIDHVLPTSYFTNNLRALSVDMAVFRDLLNVHVPDLSRHLDYLQNAARDDTTGANYEPPLTNVFTMQWFLTLFATCLPKDTALRVWDSVLLEGSEILLRTALAIWDTLKQRIMEIDSADEFYSTMGILTQEMLDCVLIDADQLIKTIYSMGEFPFPQLVELREKYTYNITPFSAAMSTGGQRSKRTAITNIFSDDDELEDEEMMENIGCFTAMFPMSGQTSPSRNKTLSDSDRSSSSYDISKVSPGAYGVTPEQLDLASVYAERMSLDLYALKQQYRKVRQRQKQAHIMLTAANARHQANINKTSKYSPKLNTVTPPIQSPVAVNHLFLGRDMRKQMKSHGKNRAIVEAPNIAPLYGGDVVPASYNVKSPQNRTNKTRASTTQSKRENFSLLSKHNVEKLQKHMGVMERAGSVVSLDSEVSATSVSDYTKGSNSTVNDSMSDVSTVCGDSSDTEDPGDLRPAPRSLLNEGSTVKSGIDSKSRSPQKEAAHPVSNKIDSRQDCDVETSKTAVVGDEETKPTGDVVKSDEILWQSQVIHADIKQDMDNQSCTKVNAEDTNSQHHNGECGKSGETPHIHQLGNVVESNTSSVNQDVHTVEVQSHGDKTDVTVGGKPTLLHLSQQVTDHCEENTSIKSGVNIAGNSDAPLKHIKPQPAGADATNFSASDNTGNYSSKTTKPRSMVRHHHIHQDNSQTMVENIPTQSSAGSTQVRTEQSKVFNPFPSHYISKRRAENGVKLGLYAADNIPKLEVGMYKGGVLKPIGRAHINACLHRQYMEDVRQSAKTSKR